MARSGSDEHGNAESRLVIIAISILVGLTVLFGLGLAILILARH